MQIQRRTIENDENYLRQISQPVLQNDENYKNEIKILEQYCLETECFALAPIQIGIPKRMVYLKNTSLDVPLDDMNYNESKVLINPIVISQKGHTKFWESCLSCLDNVGLVSRPYEMTVQYYDVDWNQHIEIFEGFKATVLSHELDHLDGILHTDIAEEILHMSSEEKKEFRISHPYEIISKNCDYNTIIKKLKRK